MRTRSLALPLLACCLAAVTERPTSALADEELDFGPVREWIERAIEEDGVPSVAVAVAKDGQIIWEEAFGFANRENGLRATPETAYSIASISKAFTATGLMLLAERGRIDLDRPANSFLGQAKLRARIGDADEATVRRVGNHTAGLPFFYRPLTGDELAPAPSMDVTIERYGNLVYPPGERYIYSNLGYGVLGRILELQSGLPYADFMRREIFEPLGLKRTIVATRQADAQGESFAVRYADAGEPLPFFEHANRGAGSIFSSARDLVRFAMFHLHGQLPGHERILSAEALAEMHRASVPIPLGEGDVGLGWGGYSTGKGYRVEGIDGGGAGANADMRIVPSEGIAIVVLTNRFQPVVAGPVREEILIALGLEERPTNEDEEEPPRRVPFGITPDLVGSWTGSIATYEGELPLTLSIKPDGDVHAQLSDQLETVLNLTGWWEDDGLLRGRMWGTIETGDAMSRPHDVYLRLAPRGDTLTGEAVALSPFTLDLGHALSHWVELRKEVEAQPRVGTTSPHRRVQPGLP